MKRVLTNGMVLLVAAALAASVGCFGKKKRNLQSAGTLTADATYAKGMDLISKGKLRDADSVLKRIQFTPDLRADLEPLARLALADATREHLLDVLERCNWNQKRATEVLGISKATLWRKLKTYGIDVKAIRKSQYP